MKRKDKRIFVTSDLLKPRRKESHSVQTIDREATKWFMEILNELEMDVHLVWKNFRTNLDDWLSREHTEEILEPYLNLSPHFLELASCVVGWELPTGLRRALDLQNILWLSFRKYLWSYRDDILVIESNDTSLLETLHQPLPRIQPTWTLDNYLRPSSLVILEPPELDHSRIRNGKIYSLNDYTDQISDLLRVWNKIYVFPQLILHETESPLLSLLGLNPLNRINFQSTVFLTSERILEIASMDPSVSHAAGSVQKPFHSWNNFHPPSALIPYRHLKNRWIWEKILERADLIK